MCACVSLSLCTTHTQPRIQPFYGSLCFVRDNPCDPVTEGIFWIFCSKMKTAQADAPTIWMDCHPIQTNWCPHLCHPHHFYAGPSLCNPPKLSWLGTGTKCAGLHTRWLGFVHNCHHCKCTASLSADLSYLLNHSFRN